MNVQMNHQLKPGTELDGRYVIEKVLGEGGFGITYQGINKRVGVKVAIKEFFWRDYVGRNCEVTSNISISKEENREAFAVEKNKFLKEARIIGDFNEEKSIVDVIDYFEANDTAYIVMNYLDGTTLKEYLKEHEPFAPEQIFKMMLPLIQTLDKIHSCGVIHRDISPDNIMVMPDNSLILLDFGAARDYSAETKNYSVVLKGGYAPSEQYDKKGKQGPWSDVYSLCATIYKCITGSTPDDSLQRILHDELKSPTERGLVMNRELEQVLMKGLSLEAKNRYQNMRELYDAIPESIKEIEKEPPKGYKRKSLILGIAAGVSCVLVILGIWYGRIYAEKNKFKGIKTETVWLNPSDEMSAVDYNAAQKVIEERVKILAGEDNYFFTEEDGAIKITTPLDVYGTQKISYVCQAYLTVSDNWYLYSTEKQKKQELTKHDILTVELKQGSIEGIGAEERETYKLPAEGEYPYVEIKLTSSKAEEAAALFEDQNYSSKRFVFQNGSSTYDMMMVAKADGQTYDLINCDTDGNFLKLLQYNLQHESFSGDFTQVAEVPANWEKVNDSLIAGENQVNVNKLDGETLVAKYELSFGTEITRGGWYNEISDFKLRLDSLDIPYAFGVDPNEETTIVIKVRQSDIGWAVLNTLGSYASEFKVANKWSDVFYLTPTNVDAIMLKEKSEGGYQFQVQISEYSAKDIQEATQKMIEDGENILYLEMGGYKIAKCRIDAPISDGNIVFEDACFQEHQKITKEILPVFQYVKTSAQETDPPEMYLVDANSMVMMSEDNQLEKKVDSSKFAYHMTDRYEKKVRDALEKEYPDITVGSNYSEIDSVLVIQLPIASEEQNPAIIPELAEKAYETGVLDDGFYGEMDVNFYHADTKDTIASIYFRGTSSERKFKVFGSVYDAVYSESVKSLVNESDFYKSFAKDGGEVTDENWFFQNKENE